MNKYRVEQLAHRLMQHDMISMHTELPAFPSGRIRLLHAVLSHQPQAARIRELLSVVTSLVQVGLDTHDLVENGEISQKGLPDIRAQQLKVLAGDYFSSRFYDLLSQAGQIEAVRRLSEAICDLNQLKMKVYSGMKQLKLSAEEYLQYKAQIASGLLLSFTGFMQGLYRRLWPEAVSLFGKCEVLLQELNNTEKAEKLSSSWGFWHVLQTGSEADRRALAENRDDQHLLRHFLDQYSVKEKLTVMLRESALQLWETAERFPSDKLVKELKGLIDPFFQGCGMEPAAALKK